MLRRWPCAAPLRRLRRLRQTPPRLLGMWVRVVLQRSVHGSVLAGAQGGVQEHPGGEANEEKARSRVIKVDPPAVL